MQAPCSQCCLTRKFVYGGLCGVAAGVLLAVFTARRQPWLKIADRSALWAVRCGATGGATFVGCAAIRYTFGRDRRSDALERVAGAGGGVTGGLTLLSNEWGVALLRHTWRHRADSGKNVAAVLLRSPPMWVIGACALAGSIIMPRMWTVDFFQDDDVCPE